MTVDGLPIPARLVALLNAGLWPRSASEALQQNLRSLVPEERIQLFAPGERSLYLYPPPFHTMGHRGNRAEERFWLQYGALDEIASELTVNIADFGIGSDALLVLDYRVDRLNPGVLRLQWSKGGRDNHWVQCASNFDHLAEMFGLEKRQDS
jgi:hypothetical protein